MFNVDLPSANAINSHPSKQGIFNVNKVAFLPNRSNMDPVKRHPMGVDIEARLAGSKNNKLLLDFDLKIFLV